MIDDLCRFVASLFLVSMRFKASSFFASIFGSFTDTQAFYRHSHDDVNDSMHLTDKTRRNVGEIKNGNRVRDDIV